VLKPALPPFFLEKAFLYAFKMSDEKRRDNDYTVDVGEEKVEGPLLRARTRPATHHHHHSLSNNAMLAVLSCCVSSVLMTTTNKHVLSGLDYNLNFLLLCVQVLFPPWVRNISS
jgi:GDP-mannose transporter